MVRRHACYNGEFVLQLILSILAGNPRIPPQFVATPPRSFSPWQQVAVLKRKRPRPRLNGAGPVVLDTLRQIPGR